MLNMMLQLRIDVVLCSSGEWHFFMLNAGKQVLWKTVRTQIKCHIMIAMF